MKRSILITGGTGKIGSVLVKRMLEDNNTVTLTTRSLTKGREMLRQNGIDPEAVHLLEVDFLQQETMEKVGHGLDYNIDAVVHTARNLDSISIDENGRISLEKFTHELNMAASFPYRLTYSIMDAGHILKDVLFIGSMYGVVGPNPGLYDDFEKQSPINYGVAKAAQIHLTKELAIRLAPKDIRVNCISYGGVSGRVNEDFKKKYSLLNPMGKMLEDKDLYPAVQFILGNRTLPITGENIKIDGGWTLW